MMLMAIPLHHAYGMIAGMSLGVALGASLALVQNPRDIEELIRTIERRHPTVFPGVPGLYNAISNNPGVKSGKVSLRSMKACISGSTALLRETKERFEDLSGGQICEGYGLSEAPVVTHCNPLLGANKIGSIGMPMPDVDCRVVDPEDGDKDVSPGESGELVLRGPQVMIRYHNMPDETEATLRRLGDGKKWLFTGDIVRMDADGYFYVVDRKKEVIKPGGFQVWPREVEEVIASHPKVLEVGVAGIPDPVNGESVKAWIVLRPGLDASPRWARYCDANSYDSTLAAAAPPLMTRGLHLYEGLGIQMLVRAASRVWFSLLPRLPWLARAAAFRSSWDLAAGTPLRTHHA
jgi:long-chain acyl-CoA synthetase